MRATIERWGRGLAALVALTALAACTLGREPAYDAAVAGEVTELTAETLRLFQDLAPGATGTHADREPQYRALAARAETVRLMAQARGSAVPASGLMLRVARLGASLSLAEEISAEGAERLAEYQDATPAYMTDYLRNLTALEDHDRAATGDQSAKQAAYQEALAAHQGAMEAYLEAFRLWQQGAGPQPAPPAAPPQPPILGLDPTRVSLRIAALEDILRDALVYERDILNRNR
ncbi:MAG: hypothetical protein ACE5EU_04265 [Paracoccaceae bacterium]